SGRTGKVVSRRNGTTMSALSAPDRLSRAALERLQADRLQKLARVVFPANRFYAAKFAVANIDPGRLRNLVDLRSWPTTTKAELLADQSANPLYGTDQTYGFERYTRI